jgi:hypothetical protein
LITHPDITAQVRTMPSEAEVCLNMNESPCVPITRPFAGLAIVRKLAIRAPERSRVIAVTRPAGEARRGPHRQRPPRPALHGEDG